MPTGFRMKASFICRLTWMPIRKQFKNLLSNLKDHKEFLELEISRASTEEALRFYAFYEQNMRKDHYPDPKLCKEREEREQKISSLFSSYLPLRLQH
jgi:hypothetical protein